LKSQHLKHKTLVAFSISQEKHCFQLNQHKGHTIAEKVLLLSPSGLGKTTSFRNLDPEETMIIKCTKKRLPFDASKWKKWDPKAKTGSVFTTRDFNMIKALLVRMEEVGKKVIIIDDFVYAMAGRVMDDIDITGFTKWSELANEFYRMIEAIDELDDDIIVILSSHSDVEEGRIKMKTAGKLIDNLITPEGMFNIVFGMAKDDSGAYFITNGSSMDPFKSPMGMFKEKKIPNDMAIALKTIKDFYGMD